MTAAVATGAPAGRARAATPPLALYVHLPWCVRKCPYCDFNSHPLHGDLPESAYVAALLTDLDFELAETSETRDLVSVYFGGGTPSLFSPGALAAILDGVDRRLRRVADAEVTLEVNPGTFRPGTFDALRRSGVNRLSIGAQSFDDDRLRALGRIHAADDTRRTVAAAHAAGFTALNLDLMFGLPGQTPADAVADVEAALALAPDHVSHYQLTVEPGTRFAVRPPALPDERAVVAAQRAAGARLAAAGLVHYEVSAHARPGRRARHNVNYWEFGDYLGIGAGAHGKRSDAAGIERRARVRSPRDYLAAAGSAAALAERRRLGPAESATEFLLNALRLRDGFDVALFEARTGQPWSARRAAAERARTRGLLEIDGTRVRASRRGWALLDTLLLELLPD